MNWIRGILRRVKDKVILTYGSSIAKGKKWNEEYQTGYSNYMESNLEEDPIYGIIYKYLKGGNLLDLGCGTGITFFHSQNVPMEYTGVDISDLAIQECKKQYVSISMSNSATFICHDIETYVPSHKFDIILLKDSIYYLKKNDVLSILTKLSDYLRDITGVFIVRIYRTDNLNHIVKTIYDNFEIVEDCHLHEGQGIVEGEGIIIVFRHSKN